MFTLNNIQNHTRRYVVLILALVGLISAATLLLSPARLASAQAVAPSWNITGNLNTGRVNHTATLLQNGKVMVAGGSNYYSGGGVLKSAELYDPSTGTWSYTGNLNTSRYNHAATLLPNGKVLVAGGYDGRPPNILNSAELYDPATGTWSLTGSLNTPRAGWLTATLLLNGKVLVVGGVNNNGVLTNSAELYDPATGMWTSTGNLNTDHLTHTATLLSNGKVLVAGVSTLVDDFFNFVNSAELYDSTTGMWSNTGSLNTARLLHTATLLPNGKVLFAGGDDFNCEVF